MKPRIGTQGIQLRVNFEKDDSVGVVAIGFFKPVQGVVIFAEARVHNEPFRRSENKNLVGRACLQREFSGDVRLYGVWVLRDSDWECILSERESILVADAVADDVSDLFSPPIDK